MTSCFPRREPSTFGLGVVLALAFAPVACWYAGHSNGANSNLQFRVERGSVAGLNLPFHLAVVRYPPQWQDICTQPATKVPSLAAGDTHGEGGDPCLGGSNSLHSVPIVLTEAHCDSDACTVSDDSVEREMPGSVLLRVTPKQAGSITVHLSVRAVDGSASWDDAYSVPVAGVDQLVLGHASADDASATYGVLVGTPAAWSPRALAADRRILAAAPEAFDTKWSGSAFVLGADGVAHAQAPGTSTVTLTAAGITKTETLRVVDPSEVVAIEVRNAIDPVAATNETSLIDVDADISYGSALASIVVDTSHYDVGPFALVLALKDGTYALGGSNSLAITGVPKTPFGPAVQVTTNKPYGWTFRLHTDGDSAGSTATLTAKVGAQTLALPLILPVNPADQPDAGDGGADAASDAKADAP